MSVSFILSVTVVLHRDDLPNSRSIENEFLMAAVVSDLTLVPASLIMLFIILQKAHSQDMVGNFHVTKPSASFSVAFVSWILDSIVTLLRGIGTFVCKDESGPAPWLLTLVYNLGYEIQQCFQMYCIYHLELKARIIREGPEWSTIRKGMYALLSFFNMFTWLTNLSAVGSLSEVDQKCMQRLLTPTVARIVHTVGRAAYLAFRIECAQLFYKYYKQDGETIHAVREAVEGEDDNTMPNLPVHTETGEGRWFGGFLAAVYCGTAVTSYILYSMRSKKSNADELYLSTGAVVLTCLTVFVTYLVLVYSGERNSHVPFDEKGPLDNISSYIAATSLRHMRLLLFYSITAVTYHFVFALHLSTVNEFDRQRLVREGAKGVTCIFLALFATWGNHRQRKLRSWRSLHVMLWMIFTCLFLDLVEECASYGQVDDNLVQYVFPLAIDFKMFVLIHAISDVRAAKKEYLAELQQPQLPGGNHGNIVQEPLLDTISVSSYGSIRVPA